MAYRLGAAVFATAACSSLLSLTACNSSPPHNPSTDNGADVGGMASDHGPTQPATAYVRVDRKGDVVGIHGEQDEDHARPAPNQGHTDIRSIQLMHTASDVQMRIRLFDLRFHTPGERPLFRVDALIKTDNGHGREVTLDFASGGADKFMFRLQPAREPVSCPFGQSYSDRRDVVVISIPRTCLHDPHWVRIAAYVGAWLHDADESFVWDDAFQDGISPTKEAAFSPPLPAPG